MDKLLDESKAIAIRIDIDRQQEEDEQKSTLNKQERSAVWNYIGKLDFDLSNLKGIAQNPMPLSAEDVREWSTLVNRLIDKLMKMDANVKKLIVSKGIDI